MNFAKHRNISFSLIARLSHIHWFQHFACADSYFFTAYHVSVTNKTLTVPNLFPISQLHISVCWLQRCIEQRVCQTSLCVNRWHRRTQYYLHFPMGYVLNIWFCTARVIYTTLKILHHNQQNLLYHFMDMYMVCQFWSHYSLPPDVPP